MGEETLKDVVGIGNAIVDVLAQADDRFLAQHEMTKGAMTLVDAQQMESIYRDMSATVEMSGGSVGNTMAGLAALGGAGSYIGKVHEDHLGEVFRHDLLGMGIAFATGLAADSAPTARCLVMVTPDGERTMATYLGACAELNPADIDPQTILNHRITYLEGYLWDSPNAKEAVTKAARVAYSGGRQVALTLSDRLCVDRHRDSFRDLLDRHVDILFANEQEIISLYQVQNFEDALHRVRDDCPLVVLTRGEKGSVVVSGEEVHVVAAVRVEQVVDGTGAGDLYAAGFLFGITHGYDWTTSGRIGAIAAAEIISHIGARPEADLQELISRAL